LIAGFQSTFVLSATNSDRDSACDVPFFNFYVDPLVLGISFSILGGAIPETPVLIPMDTCRIHPIQTDVKICAPPDKDIWVLRPIASSLTPFTRSSLMTISASMKIPADWDIILPLTLGIETACLNPIYSSLEFFDTQVFAPAFRVTL
jgi:hypothetical protein